MTQKKANPKIEWGFFAVVPRVVRTQYKDLSHTEKWLYVCLKDLCGDRGMCYRTLRVLAQETDLSTGNLSKGIRNLQEAGLIHAEKKRRSTNPTAKEVWHISIVDIWQSNVEYCSKYEHSTENVQEMNNNVQNTNNPPVECSITEQQCSNFDDRRINTEEQHIEERTLEEEGTVASFGNDAAPAFAIQIQGYPQFYYHDFCNHEQDRGCNDGLTLVVKPLDVVPPDILCQICYKPIHGPHGYYEIGKDETPAPENVIGANRLQEKITNSRLKAVNLSDSQQAIGNDDEETVPRMEAVRGDQLAHTRAQSQSHLSSQSALQANPGKVINSQHTSSLAEPVPPERSQVPAASSPPASTQQAALGVGDVPPMALTARQIKAQAEKREKELWTIIERERHTKYTRTQRTLYDNREGMKCLVEDDITDELLVSALQAMDKYQCKNFTVLKFYGWLPNLTAEDSPPQRNGRASTPAQSVDEDYTDFDKYVGNGKEERAARLKLYEEMKAKGELIS